ncbi:TIGR02281 family clan AA aspartic protease [Phenylobacterium sp.]|uniref:TIGR02281 family clan AA aspartic protease n=1 Tax=Phenylobacterium sp. TaxID=1871053 RepID=UPI0035680F2A
MAARISLRQDAYRVSTLPKFIFVAVVSGLSAVTLTLAVTTAAERAPAAQAARADTALHQPIADLAPTGPHATIRKAADGEYWAQGQVNGASVRFLVDTGASAIALTPDDARKLGIDMAGLNYGYKVVTAGGSTRAAAVKLASVTVAGARVDNVDALVIEKGLDTSLLGMSYLGRLASFQATREALILQP